MRPFLTFFCCLVATFQGVFAANPAVTYDSSTRNISPTDGKLTAAQVNLGAAGVRLTGDGDGAITFLGLGNGSDEDLTLNLDDVANTITWSSSTGVNLFIFSSIDLQVPTEVYDATGWNGDNSVPTKDAVRDKIESLGAGSGDVTAASSFGTDNRLIRSDGTGKGVQSSGVTLDDSDNITVPGTATFGSSGTGLIDVGTTGVRITDDGDGAVTFLGRSAGADEDFTLNLDDTANSITATSSTGANIFNFDGIAVHQSGVVVASSATTMTIAGTANEITSSAGAQSLAANRTWTLSLPSAMTFTGKTVTGGTLSGQTLAGVIDGGGATSFELPNANDPDVGAVGQVSIDANGNVLRSHDGANQYALAQKIVAIHVTIIAPNDLADAQRDAFLFWSNESGMSFIVTGWKGWSGTDDATLNIEEVDADGVSNNATVDAAELATGSGPYTGSDTTITAATIENGHMLVLDFDDTDTPTYVKMVILGYYAADVN